MYLDLQTCNREKEWDFLEYLVLNDTNDNKEMTKSMNDLWLNYKMFCHNNNYDINKLSSKSFHYLFTHTIITQLNKKPETLNAIVKSRTTDERFYIIDVEKIKKYFQSEPF